MKDGHKNNSSKCLRWQAFQMKGKHINKNPDASGGKLLKEECKQKQYFHIHVMSGFLNEG